VATTFTVVGETDDGLHALPVQVQPVKAYPGYGVAVTFISVPSKYILEHGVTTLVAVNEHVTLPPPSPLVAVNMYEFMAKLATNEVAEVVVAVVGLEDVDEHAVPGAHVQLVKP
jgi:hypothetical protein